MALPRTVPWGGPAAALGGGLWVAWCVQTATRPEGCVGDQCGRSGRAMRPGGALDDAVLVSALLLIGLGLVGLVLRAWIAGRFGWVGRGGAVLAGVAFAALVGSVAVQAVFFAGNFGPMPGFVLPGGIALIVGVLLIGLAVPRAGVLPRWVGALLLLGVLAMVGFNDEDGRVLLGVPFGLAWVAAGYGLWAGQGERRGPAPGDGAPSLRRAA